MESSKINPEIFGFGVRTKYDNSLFGYSTGIIDYGDNRYWYEVIDPSKEFGGQGSIDVSVSYIDKKTKLKSLTEPQQELNSIIENHKLILENNLICVRALNLCNENGVEVPAKFRQDIFLLQTRLIDRENRIRQSGYVSNMSFGYSPDLSGYNKELDAFMKNPGIGVVLTTTAVIIIVGLIIAASAGLALLLFRKENKQASADALYSAELVVDLKKYLPKPVYEKWLNETVAIKERIDTAEKKANTKAFFSTMKYLAVGLGSFYLIDLFLQNRDNKKSSNTLLLNQ
jgi:hypothetical protein